MKTGIDVPVGEPGQVVSDGREPVDARPTLARALARQVVRDAGRLHESAGIAGRAR